MANPILTSVEITDTHIKLFQSQGMRGKWQVSSCDIRPLQRFTDEEVASLLVELTRSKSISSDRLTLIISRRLAIVKSMKLPSQNINEIKKMIGLQLVNQIPYGLEDVVYDYQVTGKDQEGFTHVCVYAVHKEMIQRYLKYFEKINLHPARLTISSLGTVNYVQYLQDAKLISLPVSSLIVNIDQAHSEVLFMHQGNLTYSRHLAFGAKDLNEENVAGLSEQIQVSFAKYDKDRMGPAVNKVFIFTTLEQAQLLKQDLQEKLKVPIEMANFLERIPLNKSINLMSLRDQPGVSLISGLGLILSETKTGVNLTPAEVHEGKRTKLMKRQLVQFASLLIVIGVLAMGALSLEFYKRQTNLRRIEAELKSMSAQKQAVEQRMKFLEEFKSMLNNRVFVPEVLAAIYEMTPIEVSYRSITINEQGELTLQGYCENSAGVNNLQARLVKSPILSNVNLQFATKRKIFNMDVTDFKINAQLKAKAGEKT